MIKIGRYLINPDKILFVYDTDKTISIKMLGIENSSLIFDGEEADVFRKWMFSVSKDITPTEKPIKPEHKPEIKVTMK